MVRHLGTRRPPAVRRRLVATILGAVAVALVLQLAFLGLAVARIARSMPEGQDWLGHALPGLVWRGLAFSLLVLLPLCGGLAVLTSLPWIRALDRLAQHLRKAVHGVPTGPCDLGEGEGLRELGELVDRVLVERGAMGEPDASEDNEPAPRRAAG